MTNRKVLNAAWLCLALLGCKTIEVEKTPFEILDEYKALNVRLDRIAAPLLRKNVELCKRQKKDNGIRWHQTSDYPKELRDDAKLHWGLKATQSVFFVLGGSPADKAGVTAGDDLSSDAMLAVKDGKLICNYPVLVRYTDEINAFASGENIIVTSAMARAIKDDASLALIIAHELAHNILDHVEKNSSSDLEREADRTGMYLLARADYNYEKAIRKRVVVRAKLTGRDMLSDNEKQRAARLKDVAKEIKALQKAGKPLIP